MVIHILKSTNILDELWAKSCMTYNTSSFFWGRREKSTINPFGNVDIKWGFVVLFFLGSLIYQGCVWHPENT